MLPDVQLKGEVPGEDAGKGMGTGISNAIDTGIVGTWRKGVEEAEGPATSTVGVGPAAPVE